MPKCSWNLIVRLVFMVHLIFARMVNNFFANISENGGSFLRSFWSMQKSRNHRMVVPFCLCGPWITNFMFQIAEQSAWAVTWELGGRIRYYCVVCDLCALNAWWDNWWKGLMGCEFITFDHYFSIFECANYVSNGVYMKKWGGRVFTFTNFCLPALYRAPFSKMMTLCYIKTSGLWYWLWWVGFW